MSIDKIIIVSTRNRSKAVPRLNGSKKIFMRENIRATAHVNRSRDDCETVY